jgi:fructose-bisphosphate aldolase / 2-amino-3,7-dideoxy-D-threo-hept-6-ulosonate synthase
MSDIGKTIRISQITNQKSGHLVVVAMDHCPAIGPVPGLIDPVETVRRISEGHPDSIFMHKGNIKLTHNILADKRIPFLLSISTATTMGPYPDRVLLVDTVENAVKMGASGVSMRIFVGGQYENEMIKALGEVSAKCDDYGMVLMAMMYPKGFENDYDPKYVKHASRLGAELGADFVKTFYTGDPDSFREVTSSCPAPIVMSGGPKAENALDFLKQVKGAMDGGAAGIAAGRNVWQHPNPACMLEAVNKVVHLGMSAEQAAKELKEKMNKQSA